MKAIFSINTLKHIHIPIPKNYVYECNEKFGLIFLYY